MSQLGECKFCMVRSLVYSEKTGEKLDLQGLLCLDLGTILR